MSGYDGKLTDDQRAYLSELAQKRRRAWRKAAWKKKVAAARDRAGSKKIKRSGRRKISITLPHMPMRVQTTRETE